MKNDTQNNPNYYAIIPASVRYDDQLPATAKLLYGEIASLSNQEGFCWASNSYFGKLYKMSPRNISVLISKLEERGYIQVDVDINSGNLRNIYITEAIDKNINRYGKKYHDPIDKNIIHNNKINNKSNNSNSNINILDPAEATNSHDSSDINEVYELYLKCFKLDDETKTVDQAKKKYKLTPSRREAVKRRLGDAGIKMLKAAIVGYSKESWYKGDNDREWTADLEKFICRSYEKVEEGANKFVKQSKTINKNDPWA